MTKNNGFQVAKLQALLLPVAAISMVFVMIIPVPSVVLDILLAASITASVIVFLTALSCADCDPVSGCEPRCGEDRRGDSAVYARCAAGQADGDRRGHECGVDR
jgi:hypothetical protein